MSQEAKSQKQMPKSFNVHSNSFSLIFALLILSLASVSLIILLRNLHLS